MNWPQLKAILWMRWCLSRNQFLRGGQFGAMISLLLGGVMTLMVFGSFSTGLLVGVHGMREASPTAIMLVWAVITAAFVFFWLIGLVHELQRSESIDLQRLMHLPVSLGQVFVFNYLASHLTLSILFAVPGMVGLVMGLGVSHQPGMWLLGPLALSMVFMITSWTYCLRGWLASLMSNPRRRRSIIVGITFSMILLTQLPNLYFNLSRKRDRSAAAPTEEERQKMRAERTQSRKKLMASLVASQKFVPPFWVSYGAYKLAQARPLPAILGTFGCLAIGGLGLRRAYRSTLGFYVGAANAEPAAEALPEQPPKQSAPVNEEISNWFERLLPGVPEAAAALASATFRSMMRAPEVKMALGTSLIVTVFIGATFLARSSPSFSDEVKPLVAVSLLAAPLFFSAQILVNPFGFDRHGFRSLVLAPVPRRHILLGKNLANLPLLAGFGLLALAVSSWWLELPFPAIVALILQFAIMLLLAGMVGNLVSILVPYQVAAGSMKPTKLTAAKSLWMVLSQLFFVAALSPAALPPLAGLIWRATGMSGVVPVNLILSALLLAATVVAYWRSLGPLGRLLHLRETEVLEAVANKVE